MRPSVIRQHLAIHWQTYGVLLCVACLLGVLMLVFNNRHSHRLKVATWPSAQATIVESDVHQFSLASETRIGWRVAVDLRLSYTIAGTTYDTRYTRVSTPSIVRDFPELFRVGQKVEIRYSPEDPGEVSLHPLVQE